jgi:hypothetical protein
MKRGRSIWVIILLVLVLYACLAAAGCGGKTVATETSGTTGTSKPSSTTSPSTDTSSPGTTAGASGNVLTGPYEEPPYLDSKPVDLAAIINLGDAPLTDTQKQVLARQSFVATLQDPINGPQKFWHVYETARYQGLPVLVTTDSLLNAYHGLFDTLLQRMEEAALYDQAVAMTEALLAAATAQYSAATDAAVKEDARLDVAFFTVADSLLKGTTAAPSLVGDEVTAELANIEGAGGIATSAILGYVEDFSQYKPRGHYTRSEKLKRYFKAMMWYGHTGFFINPRNPDISQELALSLTRRAILVSSSLTGAAKQAWTAIYEPTSFLVGRADDLTVDDMANVVAQVFGTAQPAPDDLADAAKITAVREALNKLPAPKIQSAAVPDSTPGSTQTREENQRSFRVMGQRYIPDSYAFQQLVSGYVGDDSKPREFPMGLDVMTVLGSDQAYIVEKKDFGQDQFKNWESQVKKINGEFNSKAADIWPANLYTGWLESLQQVMAFPATGAPDFMKSRAWARKSLNTALGSWTELRHDTILYAKQSIVAEGDGGEEPKSAGYVEPYPAFYKRIGELATTLRQSMDDYNLADEQAAQKLDDMIQLAQTLATIAQKELDGQPLTDEETNTIVWYGARLEGLETWYTSDAGETLSPPAEKSPIVADVHTNVNSGEVLEEGTGYPLVLYVAFELDGKLQLFAGASYAYYEFKAPMSDRLTDEQWTAMLDTGTQPPRPAWTDEWIVK